MANQKERIKAVIAKDIRDILLFEVRNNVGFVTVTDVIVSDDYSYVKVYVSFLDHPQDNFEKLNKTKGYVRSSLAKKIDLRRSPEVSFVLDDTYFKTKKLDEALEKEEEDIKNMSKK